MINTQSLDTNCGTPVYAMGIQPPELTATISPWAALLTEKIRRRTIHIVYRDQGYPAGERECDV